MDASRSMSADDDELVSIARMGMDAEKFMASEVGRFLIERTTAEADALVNELIAADPTDIKANTTLRMQIAACRMSLDRLAGLATDGLNAIKALHDKETVADTGD